MGRACATYMREKRNACGVLVRKLKETDHLEDLGIKRNIILILRK
jgi:uncharacterized protein YjiS (DUF1127 family)